MNIFLSICNRHLGCSWLYAPDKIGDCTLSTIIHSLSLTFEDSRIAINQANTDAGEDLIVFERSLFSNQQMISFRGGLDITHNLDIIAPRDPLTGGDLVTVSGNKEASRGVFEIEAGALSQTG